MIRTEVADLLSLGPFPPSDHVHPAFARQQQELLERITPPASDDEARALVKLLGPDDYCGLAWTVVHVIESAPHWPLMDCLVNLSSEWVARLMNRRVSQVRGGSLMASASTENRSQPVDHGVHQKLRRMLTAPYAGKGASEDALDALRRELGYRLPALYVDFLRETNGYNGEAGQHGYVNIWPVEEVVPTNKANDVRESVPGLVLFGSNEGGEFYAFDMRRDPVGVVMVPMIPLELESAIDVGTSFVDFLERLARQPPP